MDVPLPSTLLDENWENWWKMYMDGRGFYLFVYLFESNKKKYITIGM